MHRDFRRHRLFEKVRRSSDGDRGERRGREERDGALLALLFELIEWRDALRDYETRHVERGDIAHALLAQARRQRLQIFRFRLADDLHTPRLGVFVIAGEREAGLPYARAHDGAAETVVAGGQLQREITQVPGNDHTHSGLEQVFLV